MAAISLAAGSLPIPGRCVRRREPSWPSRVPARVHRTRARRSSVAETAQRSRRRQPGRAHSRATPIMASRVTRPASASSDHASVLLGAHRQHEIAHLGRRVHTLISTSSGIGQPISASRTRGSPDHGGTDTEASCTSWAAGRVPATGNTSNSVHTTTLWTTGVVLDHHHVATLRPAEAELSDRGRSRPRAAGRSRRDRSTRGRPPWRRSWDPTSCS